MDLELKDKVAIVGGASKGLGRVVQKCWLKKGPRWSCVAAPRLI